MVRWDVELSLRFFFLQARSFPSVSPPFFLFFFLDQVLPGFDLFPARLILLPCSSVCQVFFFFYLVDELAGIFTVSLEFSFGFFPACTAFSGLAYIGFFPFPPLLILVTPSLPFCIELEGSLLFDTY